MTVMSPSRTAQRPPGFIEPCLPKPVLRPPDGPGWFHEVKHDGYRLQVHRDGARVRLFTRNGFDWTERYPAVVAAALALPATSFLIDGEVVVPDPAGVPSFDLLRSRQDQPTAFLWAFDLMSVDGVDLRAIALEKRREGLAWLLREPRFGIALNDHEEIDGPLLFAKACELGLEGIVSKRRGCRYVSGKSDTWVKAKNPASKAAIREATEDWNKDRRRA